MTSSITKEDLEMLEEEAKAQIPSTNAKKILILITELRAAWKESSRQFDNVQFLKRDKAELNEKIQIAEEIFDEYEEKIKIAEEALLKRCECNHYEDEAKLSECINCEALSKIRAGRELNEY